jgi:hypothetical protein
MEIGRLIASLVMIMIGLFCIIFNKKLYQWNKKWRDLFPNKKSYNEKSLLIYLRTMSIIGGIGFIVLGIDVIIAYW